MKNRKGFTLIEIMIVVAIIGILALVLIPKIGGMKDQAKLSGIDTNLRIAQSMVENLINNYDATDTDTGADGLETALVAKLWLGDPTKDMKNPMTDTSADISTAKYGADGPAVKTSAFTYVTGDEANFAAIASTLDLTLDVNGNITADTDNATAMANRVGQIYFGAYLDGTMLKVKLIPFDDTGAVIIPKVRTISK